MDDRYLGIVAFAVWILSVIAVAIVLPNFVATYASITGPMLAIILNYYFKSESEARAKAQEIDASELLVFIAALLIIGLAAIAFIVYVAPLLPKIY